MTELEKMVFDDFSFFVIAGPCVIENYELTFKIAKHLKQVFKKLDVQFVFKASYDKANRTSVDSFRGPGLTAGLDILKSVKEELDIAILSDVHETSQIEMAQDILDIIQIPAFLCRQTDLLVQAAKTGKIINIKKGQFLSPMDIINAAAKCESTGNKKVFITERGSMFGYNNLVTDFRSIKIMQDNGFPVVFDATHSVQLPGGKGSCSGGQREFVSVLSRAAVAAGANGIFVEVYPDPKHALCDGPNSLRLDDVFNFVSELKIINGTIRKMAL